MWYEKRIEESAIRSILEVSFECLEHQIKAFKDSDFKDCIFTTVQQAIKLYGGDLAELVGGRGGASSAENIDDKNSNVMYKIIQLIFTGEELAINMAELVKSIVDKGNY
jgi:hypothetical protein